MKALDKRLDRLEGLSGDRRGRLVCIKATMDEPWCADQLLSAAGIDSRAADTVVIIRKPAGTGGPDRVLSIDGENLG